MLFLKIKNLYNDNTVNNITRTMMSFVVEEIDYEYISENTPNCGEKNLLQGTPVTQVSHLSRGDKLCGTRSDQRTGFRRCTALGSWGSLWGTVTRRDSHPPCLLLKEKWNALGPALTM